MWWGCFAWPFAAESRCRPRAWRLAVALPLVYTCRCRSIAPLGRFMVAVGYAARSGLEIRDDLSGPSLVMNRWWWILRRLVAAIGRSIA